MTPDIETIAEALYKIGCTRIQIEHAIRSIQIMEEREQAHSRYEQNDKILDALQIK
jgi:hypothetical protein